MGDVGMIVEARVEVEVEVEEEVEVEIERKKVDDEARRERVSM